MVSTQSTGISKIFPPLSAAMMFVLLLTVLIVTAAESQGDVPAICQKMSPCGADCYTTCDNVCQCDLDRKDRVPFPVYGGECQRSGFCEKEFLHLEDCVEEGGPSCPNSMISLDQVVKDYYKYDYRIDVRTVGEWEEGHGNMSIHTPGLAKNKAAGYMDKLAGLEDANLLVYCRSGGRAFSAAMNLLRYGFSNVNVFYQGGFPNLQAAIFEESENNKKAHPTKNYCYIEGSSDLCPQALPLFELSSAEDIMGLGENVVLVDVRPRKSFPEQIESAVRVPNKKHRVQKFLAGLKGDETVVTYCMEGTAAFNGARSMRKFGFTGPLYYIDKGGYNDIKDWFN